MRCHCQLTLGQPDKRAAADSSAAGWRARHEGQWRLHAGFSFPAHTCNAHPPTTRPPFATTRVGHACCSFSTTVALRASCSPSVASLERRVKKAPTSVFTGCARLGAVVQPLTVRSGGQGG